MEFPDFLYALFHQTEEETASQSPATPCDEESSREMFFCIEENQSVFPFACDRIYICEPEEGSLSFSNQETGKTHALLMYRDNRWHITVTNKQVEVWLTGIRLKYGQPYLVRSGDHITLTGMVSFIVQCHPLGIPSQNRLEEMQCNLEQDMQLYTKSQGKDRAAFNRIKDALLHVPLFYWGGFRTDPATGMAGHFAMAIPANRSEDWVLRLDEIDMDTNEAMCIPVFTSVEEAIKNDCPLGAFPHGFPLRVFSQIVKRDMDVEINPFSQHAVKIPKETVKELWKEIQELNNTEELLAPDWRMRSELLDHMQETEDDLFDEF